jgi:hypothetical protein
MLINHAQFQPTPRDMLFALQKIAELVNKQTGKTPDIFVGQSKLYPPKDGKAMDNKTAVAAHEALYGGKGTITVKDGKTPVFKQVNGGINKDEFQLQQKLSPETKEKYQELLDKHSLSKDFSPITYDDRLAAPIVDQKMADNMVMEMAMEENLLPEEFTRIVAQGSGYVNTHLDAKIDAEGPSISEGLDYLAEITSEYHKALLDKAELSEIEEIEEIVEIAEIAELPPPDPVDEIAELTAKIEALQSEVSSMKKTMTKIVNQEPIPFLKAWAKNKIDTVITNVQDRAKVDMVKTVNFGKNLAQRAMDSIASTAGLFEQGQLNIDGISKDLKTMFEFHDNVPEIELGDYTYKNNDGGVITVSHKERGEVFIVDGDKGPKLGPKFNASDYQTLSRVKETVAVAITAQVAKELAVGAVKESAQKSAVKL